MCRPPIFIKYVNFKKKIRREVKQNLLKKKKKLKFMPLIL
jgi:hypothetical protein